MTEPKAANALDPGRWVNGVKLGAAEDAELDAEQYDQDQQSTRRKRNTVKK